MTADHGEPGPTGRHAAGRSSRAWTPEVRTGSGGRRRVMDAPVAAASSAAPPEPQTVVVAAFPGEGEGLGASPHRAARRVLGVPLADRSRSPIRYAPVPGAPRRRSAALWGPPLPVAGA